MTASMKRIGAYAVTKTGQRPAQVVRVVVPDQVYPGQEFMVQLDDRRVKVACPPNSGPGQQLQITLPPEPLTTDVYLEVAQLTAAEGPGGGGAVARNGVRKPKKPQAFLVTIPPTVYPGMPFKVDINGKRFQLTCPPNVGPNMKVKIVPPNQDDEEPSNGNFRQELPKKGTAQGWDDNRTLPEKVENAAKTQMFEVIVPKGVQPNQPFALKANGQRVLVTCPPNVRSGQRIRFQIPVTQMMVSHIQLNYSESEGKLQQQVKQAGWCRTIRATDMKFQWVRVDKETDDDESASSLASSEALQRNNNGQSTRLLLDTSSMDKFHFNKSAYCRLLTFIEGNDHRMRTGQLSWIPAKEAATDSKIAYKGSVLVTYAELAEIQRAPSLEIKLAWFEERICKPLLIPYDDGYVKLLVRREFLLNDSVTAIMSLSREEMRKKWRFQFVGEGGLDAGGLTREWFELVTEQLYDPAFGLWNHPTSTQQGSVTIHPNSSMNCPEDHLVYFRVLGRILGRALLDRQLVHRGGHMARFLYKHLLGFPITFDDLKELDFDYYNNLKKLVDMGADIEYACLDFTVTEDQLGAKRQVELVPDGANKEVTVENLGEYLEASLRYRMMDRIQPQLTELLLGFFDVVPEPALTIFDCNELELVLCGLPTIDLSDWENNTAYDGLYQHHGPNHPIVRWFWEVITEDFDTELQARLLQFVTGTSGVPSRGFSALQGNDGSIRLFTVYGTDPSTRYDKGAHDYPCAHTCFNRLDLPTTYKSREELREKLKVSITVGAVGFDMD